MFTELLPAKLVRGKSAAVLSGFCFVHSITAGIKAETEDANSSLQAAKAALTADLIISCLVASSVSTAFFLNSKLHLLVDVDLTKLPSLPFGLSVLLVVVLPLGTVSDAVHTSMLRLSVHGDTLEYVQGPVEMGVPLGPHRRLRR